MFHNPQFLQICTRNLILCMLWRLNCLTNFPKMKKLLIATVCVLLVVRVAAQDTHYWSQQFSTRSALLGGSVVAGTNDNTVIYYNPGALGFIDTGSISINANLYQIENIKILNALGKEADFKSSQIGTVPLLVGGMLRNRNSAWKIGYGLISPVSFNFKATARLDGSYPVVETAESSGNEDLIGQQDTSTKLSEIALGIGAGRKLNDYWSFGFTGFFQVRSQTYSKSSLVRAYLNDEDNTLVSTTVLQQLSYYNVRFIPKFGLAYRKQGWAAGITLTLPALSMFGNGTVAGDATASNIKSVTTNERFDFVTNDRQEKLKTKYKSPLSVAVGLSRTFNRSQLHFSAQYFGKVAEYNIIQAKSAAFARPADAYPDFTSDEFLRVRTAANSVFNFAIGYE